MKLARAKFVAEEALRASGLEWTIIRPAAFMETWSEIVGEPLLRTGRTRVFGRGKNPINFVSLRDVAALVDTAVADPDLRGVTLDIAGPQDLTMNDVAELFATGLDRPAGISHVPLPMMRAAAVLLRPVAGGIARMIAAGVIMDTVDLTSDRGEAHERVPTLPRTRFPRLLTRCVRRSKLRACLASCRGRAPSPAGRARSAATEHHGSRLR